MSLIKYFEYRFYFVIIFFCSCNITEEPELVDNYESNIKEDPGIHMGTTFIASYEQALEENIRDIPVKFIMKARNDLHVAFQHTSHGTHVSYGIFGLQKYKNGDDVLFAVTNQDPLPEKLDFRDNVLVDYAPSDIDASDLSKDETGFIQTSRNFLDDPNNSEINVVMWSWCNIEGHNIQDNYLAGMDSLIREYSFGGSKIGTEEGQRINPVHFVFMTGHANKNDNLGLGKPKNQADLIIEYCKSNNQYCLDYYGIDTHDMSGNYWSDAGDNGDSESYGGNFYHDWQIEHTLGHDFFENRDSPNNGSIVYGEHNTQHITANRKAYAFWWIMARIVGWDGNTQ